MSNLGNKDIFSRNLNKYLESSNKSRSEVCEDLGIKYSTFTDWINGNKYPRIDKIELLANYFNISKSDLIEGSADNETEVLFVNENIKLLVKKNEVSTNHAKNLIRLINYYNALNPNTQKMAFDYLEHLSSLQQYENELRAAHNDNADKDDELERIKKDFDKF